MRPSLSQRRRVSRLMSRALAASLAFMSGSTGPVAPLVARICVAYATRYTGRSHPHRVPAALDRRKRRNGMELSARNQLKGTVKSVTLGTVMAEVVVDVNGQD